MSGTDARPALASYRDSVTVLMRAGEPFGEVEDAIDQLGDVSDDAKAALWLLAFSLRDPRDQVSAARAHLATVG
jgi:hypothetical protein